MSITRTAYVEIRSQHSVGSSRGGYGGPDTYVAIQYCEPGKRLKVLNRRYAQRRDNHIRWIGEGYSAHRSSRSALGRAIAEAEQIAREYNTEQDWQWVAAVHHG